VSPSGLKAVIICLITPTLILLKFLLIIARPTRGSTLLGQKYSMSMKGMRYGPNMKLLYQRSRRPEGTVYMKRRRKELLVKIFHQLSVSETGTGA
jgi:hypothetical protein